MKYVCPKCGKNIDLSAEALIASEYRTVCPQCLSQLEIVGDYAYIQPEGDPLLFDRGEDQPAAAVTDVVAQDVTAVTPPALPPQLPPQDPLYDAAVHFVSQCNAITPMMLRDYFGIDMERAHTLMAQLERDGVVGPYRNGAPRQILIPHNTDIPYGIPQRYEPTPQGQPMDDPQQNVTVHRFTCGGCLMWILIIAFAVFLFRMCFG